MVRVPAQRWQRWVANFEDRHGEGLYEVADGALRGRAADGSHFTARLPFDEAYAGGPLPADFAAAAAAPEDWGVLLVRKGGFAVARLAGERIVASKVGRRHVQGRTKAGGQSQQRFARRRANQARAAYDAAAEHASSVLDATPILVVGGDRAAIDAVLDQARLRARIVDERIDAPDPRRDVLDAAVATAQSLCVEVVNADERADG